MDKVALASQVIIALGIFNVWILRFNQSTGYRPGSAGDMKEEFSAYGLPSWAVYVIGSLKGLLALSLVVGIWVPSLVKPAAAGMALLMLGAIVMHFKVKDPPKKALPASGMLVLSVLVILFHGT